jgi:hypothetical protein
MEPLYTIVLGARTKHRTKTGREGIFTDDDLATIEKIVRDERKFEGFSLAKLTGFWKGKSEDTIEIKVLCKDLGKVEACAQQLRRTFRQDAVLVTCQGTGMFLT